MAGCGHAESDAVGKSSGYGLFTEDVRRLGRFARCVKEWKVVAWKEGGGKKGIKVQFFLLKGFEHVVANISAAGGMGTPSG